MDNGSTKMMKFDQMELLQQMIKNGNPLMTINDGSGGRMSDGGMQGGMLTYAPGDLQHVAAALANTMTGQSASQQYHTASASYATPSGQHIGYYINEEYNK